MFRKKFNKVPISQKPQRVVLSDILPYELPPTFSNSDFYKFLVQYDIRIEGDKIIWRNDKPGINSIVKLLCGIINPSVNSTHFDSDLGLTSFKVELKNSNRASLTIPFNFKITHKESDHRELTVIHPFNQLSMVEFYLKHKELILYYCNLSPYSIRKAYKLAYYKYHKDKTHLEILSKNQQMESGEEYDKEYESLKTFFVYKNYSNIHKFFESYKYHRCEKKYSRMIKFDLSKCFDSIYTHSLTWAILNKEIVKAELSSSNNTFSGKFDKIMRDLNHGETNGIVIGPEFSRIFAELILQKIDRDVHIYLNQKYQWRHKVEYEIFRYVDDYFIFYDDKCDIIEIIKAFKIKLKDYKLYINENKTVQYEKPLITEITIAKQRISDLINKHLNYSFKIVENTEEPDDLENELDNSNLKGSIYVSSNKLITKFKTIIREAQIDYKDILNYTLSAIDLKVARILEKYSKTEQEPDSEKKFIKAVLEILDFTFFLYTVSPRVNITIKLCRILTKIIYFHKGSGVKNRDYKHQVYKLIYDNILFVLKKNKVLEHTPIETLYLLVTLEELGKEYKLSLNTLMDYFNLTHFDGHIKSNIELNYFSLIQLLFYIKNKKQYVSLKTFVQDYCITRFNERKEILRKDTESILLLFDLIACPYIEIDIKKKLLTLYGINEQQLQDSIINERKHWFTKWTNFNFIEALEAKKGQDVY